MNLTTEQRDAIGRLVREAWCLWAMQQPISKPSWLVPWDGLNESDREADRIIGEAVWDAAYSEFEQQLAAATARAEQAERERDEQNRVNDSLTGAWEQVEQANETCTAWKDAFALVATRLRDAGYHYPTDGDVSNTYEGIRRLIADRDAARQLAESHRLQLKGSMDENATLQAGMHAAHVSAKNARQLADERGAALMRACEILLQFSELSNGYDLVDGNEVVPWSHVDALDFTRDLLADPTATDVLAEWKAMRKVCDTVLAWRDCDMGDKDALMSALFSMVAAIDALAEWQEKQKGIALNPGETETYVEGLMKDIEDAG